MNEFLVLVPTTQKLVGITDIVEENKGVLPVVCVTNELKSLPISNEYKNFVSNSMNEGVTLIGGCCEVKPRHIEALSSLF